MRDLSGLLTFLLFAGAFFLMMRGGCGGHAGHGGHHGNQRNAAKETPSSDVDPVCGMRVPADSGYAKIYHGTPYRFCSRECLDKFDESPEVYLSRKANATGHQGHGP